MISVFQSLELNLTSVIYNNNNLIGDTGFQKGGFLRSEMVWNRFFKKIIISNSYSDRTTIGLKFIDDILNFDTNDFNLGLTQVCILKFEKYIFSRL